MRKLIRSTGGRRPTLTFVAQAAAAGLGAHGALRRVNWPAVRRLVFVCSGNICRSPYAAERARQMGMAVASFGVDASGNAPADPTASAVAMARNVDLAEHVSMGLRSFVALEGDLLLGLEPRHLKPLAGGVAGVAGVAPAMTLLGLWCDRALPYLPDPYGKSEECFEFVFGLIDEALVNIARRMGRQG